MTTKWNCSTTTKFIHEYKRHECLWNFQSPFYKNRPMREAAYFNIVEAMNLPDCGIQDVKNKIKNLRSTYNQELKKIEDSKKAGAGAQHVYESNIKWIKELEPFFISGEKRTRRVNLEVETQEVNSGQNEESSQAKITMQLHHVLQKNLSPPTTAKRKKKELRTENNLISSNDCERDASDVFGESVAIQLKQMTEERALLAKCKIQTILTEYGIADLQEKKNLCTCSNRNFSSLPSASTRDTIHSCNSDYSVYESTSSTTESNDPLTHSHSSCFGNHSISPSDDMYDMYEPTDDKEALAYVVANTYPDQKDILG